MGDYATLFNLDKKSPKPVVQQDEPPQRGVQKYITPPPLQPVKQSVLEAKTREKPEIMKSRKPERASPASNVFDTPEKYSTLLRPSLKKKVKLHAVELDIDDCEVID